jgi:hypothetical protein
MARLVAAFSLLILLFWSFCMFRFRSTVRQATAALVAAGAICAVGPCFARAQDAKKTEKVEIPGGIEGQVKSVDHEKETLTIVASTGKDRTFKVTEETTMIGPRGGKVRKRLNDKRFHEGMELTVVADGTSAKEIHLGFSKRDPGDTAVSKPAAKQAAKKAAKRANREERDRLEEAAAEPAKTKVGKMAKAAAAKAAAAEEEDEDDEIPGKVKSFDPARRVLVVSLLNGKSRSFLLANDVKVMVKGTASKEGLKDAALKDGAVISVFVEAGGRRVKELHVTPAVAARTKKAA